MTQPFTSDLPFDDLVPEDPPQTRWVICLCGAPAAFYSAALERSFCGDVCWEDARKHKECGMYSIVAIPCGHLYCEHCKIMIHKLYAPAVVEGEKELF